MKGFFKWIFSEGRARELSDEAKTWIQANLEKVTNAIFQYSQSGETQPKQIDVFQSPVKSIPIILDPSINANGTSGPAGVSLNPRYLYNVETIRDILNHELIHAEDPGRYSGYHRKARVKLDKFKDSGMAPEQISKKTGLPLDLVRNYLSQPQSDQLTSTNYTNSRIEMTAFLSSIAMQIRKEIQQNPTVLTQMKAWLRGGMNGEPPIQIRRWDILMGQWRKDPTAWRKVQQVISNAILDSETGVKNIYGDRKEIKSSAHPLQNNPQKGDIVKWKSGMYGDFEMQGEVTDKVVKNGETHYMVQPKGSMRSQKVKPESIIDVQKGQFNTAMAAKQKIAGQYQHQIPSVSRSPKPISQGTKPSPTQQSPSLSAQSQVTKSLPQQPTQVQSSPNNDMTSLQRGDVVKTAYAQYKIFKSLSPGRYLALNMTYNNDIEEINVAIELKNGKIISRGEPKYPFPVTKDNFNLLMPGQKLKNSRGLIYIINKINPRGLYVKTLDGQDRQDDFQSFNDLSNFQVFE